MLTPPFKRSPQRLVAFAPQAGGLKLAAPGPAAAATRAGLAPRCCDHDAPVDDAAADALPNRSDLPATPRTKLQALDPHLHCSVLGTCLSTGELRKLMARHLPVKALSDLDVHHTAVGLAAQPGDVAKALHKALDHRHAGVVRTFAAAKDEAALEAAWHQAWQQGEIPGAYWALLTHKAVTPDLRQLAFGAVHMLSHLMGSANRQEIRRFVALERDSADLHDKLDREQGRRHALVQERDRLAGQLHHQALAHEAELARLRAQQAQASGPSPADLQLVALHTERREQAERTALAAQQQAETLQRQLERLQAHAQAMAEELGAAEAELQRFSAATAGDDHSRLALNALTVLYVGGRPSTLPSIRDFVARHGGTLRHHDGGIESRKGLLAAQLPKADLVVFPVDCIDHHSALNLKKLCERHQREFVALRSAGLASFAAALQRRAVPQTADPAADPRFCLKHG